MKALFRVGVELDEPVTLEQLAEAWARHERDGALLARATARLEAECAHASADYLSMQAFLRAECRMSSSDAAKVVHRGRFLLRHSTVGDAAVAGRLSSGQEQAVRTAVSPAVDALFTEHEAELVPALEPLDVPTTRAAMHIWRARADALVDAPVPPVPDQSLSYGRADDGTLVGRFVLDPVTAAELEQALKTAERWDGPDDPRTPAHRRADALHDVLWWFNTHHTGSGTTRHRPHIELVLDAERLDLPVALTGAGAVIPVADTEALLCDSVVRRVVTAGSTVLDYGRSVRTVPSHLFRALALRDGGCRFPGCDRPAEWCEAHHTPAWEDGGTTDPAHLALHCSRHHHQVHRERVTVTVGADARVTYVWPSGRSVTTHPHTQARPPNLP